MEILAAEVEKAAKYFLRVGEACDRAFEERWSDRQLAALLREQERAQRIWELLRSEHEDAQSHQVHEPLQQRLCRVRVKCRDLFKVVDAAILANAQTATTQWLLDSTECLSAGKLDDVQAFEEMHQERLRMLQRFGYKGVEKWCRK